MTNPSATDDFIAKAFTEASSAVDGAETRLSQLQDTDMDSYRSDSPMLSPRSVTPEPASPIIPGLRLSTVEGSRVVVKMEKELVVKKLFTLCDDPCARKLRKKMDELFPVKPKASTPSCTPPVCRTGRNVVLLISSIVLPFARNIETERVFCFRSDGLGSSVDMKLPLVPENIQRVAHVDKPNIGEPYVVLFYRKIQHKKNERTTVVEAFELRAIETTAQADNEVFSEVQDRKTERLAYMDRIFVGQGVVRIVTEFTVNSRSLDVTQLTRHFWKCDFVRVEPFLSTPRQQSAVSIQTAHEPTTEVPRMGSISDTSAGSPPSTISPFSRMQRGEQPTRIGHANATAVPEATPDSSAQELLQGRRELSAIQAGVKMETPPTDKQ